MKITIYELLGLIKDGKAPTKFKYKNRVFYLVDNDYWCDEIGGWFSVEALDISILNEEVEIMEEDKKIEKLNLDADKLKGNEKVRAYPNAAKDSRGRLLCGASVGITADMMDML